MHPHEQLIHDFYSAFKERNHEAMAVCYHPEIRFSDPAFPDLRGPRAAAMWRMLCERGTDLELEYSQVEADETTGSAHWQARYTFRATRRKVHNKISAQFRFRDGKIVEHRDRFDFWAWSRQALGPAGLLLGWTPLLRRKVQRTAGSQLDRCCENWGIE